jgi:hypothetical protein
LSSFNKFNLGNSYLNMSGTAEFVLGMPHAVRKAQEVRNKQGRR